MPKPLNIGGAPVLPRWEEGVEKDPCRGKKTAAAYPSRVKNDTQRGIGLFNGTDGYCRPCGPEKGAFG